MFLEVLNCSRFKPVLSFRGYFFFKDMPKNKYYEASINYKYNLSLLVKIIIFMQLYISQPWAFLLKSGFCFLGWGTVAKKKTITYQEMMGSVSLLENFCFNLNI